MTGTLTISIEIELGWGVHDLGTWGHLSADGSAERHYLRELLRKTEETDVPISFDIVGHLLLDECDGTHSGPYEPGWFDADPGTDVETDPLFYAPDMANAVLESTAGHELCTHTFSHLLCHEASDELLDLELERVQSLHSAIDEPVSSFVPPRHYPPNNEVLTRNGIETARYAIATSDTTQFQRFKELTIGPAPTWPMRTDGSLLETYCTTYPSLTASSLPAGQDSVTEPVFAALPIPVRHWIHRRYLRRSTRRAIRNEEPLHLWCHLYDICNDHQWPLLADYFDFLATIPDDDLQIVTMAEL